MSAPKQYPRAERVRHQIQQVLAAELEKLRDPGVGYVTITEVRMTPDLRTARAYYTVLGSEVEHAATRDALARATKHLRAAVANQVRLRYAPALEMIEDLVPEQAAHIDQLIAELHRKESE